jgi:hypothetical protein
MKAPYICTMKTNEIIPTTERIMRKQRLPRALAFMLAYYTCKASYETSRPNIWGLFKMQDGRVAQLLTAHKGIYRLRIIDSTETVTVCGCFNLSPVLMGEVVNLTMQSEDVCSIVYGCTPEQADKAYKTKQERR